MAVTLYRALNDFVRHYQFRNRNEVCCYGVTVSQCYLLDILAGRGPGSMRELASHLCLEVSTVTRLVDGLVKRRLVRRQRDVEDKRVVRVELTEAGQKLHGKITEDLLAKEEELLRSLPEELRQGVVQAVVTLLHRVSPDKAGCCTT